MGHHPVYESENEDGGGTFSKVEVRDHLSKS
jgi:hypothetical protein